MKKHFTLLFCILNLSLMNAQEFNWALGMGGEGFDDGRAIGVDAEGNIFVGGKFQDVVEFAPGINDAILDSGGNSDTYLAKFDSEGKFIWVRHLDGIPGSENLCSDLATDSEGNVIIVGEFTDLSDFDPLTTAGIVGAIGRDGYIAKYNTDGDFLWVHHVSGGGEMEIMAITVDDDDQLYHTGRFRSTQTFGEEQISSKGVSDGYIAKLNSNGEHIWVKHFGSAESDAGLNVKVSGTDLFVTGYFEETIDFDYGSGTDNATSLDDTDGFIQKMNTNGDHEWVITWGGQSLDEGNSIAIDDNGDVYVAGEYLNEGYFTEEVIFPAVSGGSGFLLKILSDGTRVWVAQCLEPVEIVMNGDGHIFAAGTSSIQKLQIGEGIVDELEFEKLSGTGINEIKNMTIDASGNIYATGQFWDEIDFDPSDNQAVFTSNKWSDGFIVKLSSEITSTKAFRLVQDLTLFPNPASHTIQIQSGTMRGECYVELLSNTGQILDQRTMFLDDSNSLELPANLSPGFYTYRITQEDQVGLLKFVKQ